MYALDRKIEELENSLIDLKAARDEIEDNIDAMAQDIADRIRDEVVEATGKILDDTISFHVQTSIDMEEIEQEIIETLSDEVRDNL